jgi:hypothetical protein
MSNFYAPSFGSTFSKGGLEHEQMMSDLFEEIELKRECAQLVSQFKQLDTSPDLTAQRRELIRVLRFKRDRLKILNPSLFPQVEVDKENEQIICDVIEEVELKRECGPLLAQLRDTAVIGEQRKELIRILRLKRDRLKVLNPSLFL